MNQTGIEKDVFGKTADGETVDRYTLRNAGGAAIRLITFGAIVTELETPDQNGKLADIVLGFDDLRSYETVSPHFGCMAGRVAFRIAHGEFILDGKKYQLETNNGQNHLHGGRRGFSHLVWKAEPTSVEGTPAVKFKYRSPDGDQGYPGTVDTEVVYSWNDRHEMRIDCTATTDQPTIINLTHHSYFNLAGAGRGDVLGHVLQLDADRFIPSIMPDSPTGEIASVTGTPFDFNRPTEIGSRIHQTGGDPEGYDLCYLHNHPGDCPNFRASQNGNVPIDAYLNRVAEVLETSTGRKLEVSTTEPAFVLYTGNFLDGSLRGKGGTAYRRHAGLCLETGRPPNAIRYPNFPSIILRPGQTYRHLCVYRFSTI